MWEVNQEVGMIQSSEQITVMRQNCRSHMDQVA